MRIFFVLHGDTAAAGSGKLTTEDQPLATKGKQQARQAALDLANQLNQLPVTRILASPRLRAKQTADIIASELKFAGDVELDSRLAERDCSPYGGQLITDVFARPESELVSGGMEPQSAVLARSKSLLNEILADAGPGVVVLVSHSSNYEPFMVAIEKMPRNAGLELKLPDRNQAVELKPQQSNHGQSANDQSVGQTAVTYDKIADEYMSTELRQVVAGTLDKFASMLKGQSVLNVGCAGGQESGYLAQKGLVVSGCDISENFIRAARQAYPDCKFFMADMRHLPGNPGSYDGIWCNAAFLHIPKSDAPGTLKGFAKLLKPGGMLYVSVMRGEFDGLRTNIDMNWGNRHFSDYQPDEMLGLLKEAGFSPLGTDSKDTDWGPVFLHFFATKA